MEDKVVSTVHFFELSNLNKINTPQDTFRTVHNIFIVIPPDIYDFSLSDGTFYKCNILNYVFITKYVRYFSLNKYQGKSITGFIENEKFNQNDIATMENYIGQNVGQLFSWGKDFETLKSCLKVVGSHEIPLKGFLEPVELILFLTYSIFRK